MKTTEIKGLKELLAPSFGDFEIIEQKSRSLTPPGEHYGSIMLALDLVIRKNGRDEFVHLVGKFLPASEMLREAFDTNVTFKKEVTAYLDVIPAFRLLQKEHGVPEEERLNMFPKCMGARLNLDKNQNEVGEDAVLIFENLKVKGFDTYDRYRGFDAEATKLILKDLSTFHAVALAMKLQKPDLFQEIVGPCLIRNAGFDNNAPELDEALKYSVVTVSETIPEVAQYSNRLETAFDDGKAYFISIKSSLHQWGTVIHGDYWLNNTMVKKDSNGVPIENKIVDLQILEYNSVIHDLIFFLFTSIDNDILEEHYESFIEVYHSSFLKTLNELKVDTSPYSLEELKKEINRVAPKEAFHVFFMLRFIFAEKLNIKSMEEFQPSDWTRKDLLGERHKQKVKATILAFVKRNWI